MTTWPAGWTPIQLSQVGRCYRGVSYDPELDLMDAGEAGSVPLLRANNVQHDRLELADLQHVRRRRVSERQLLRQHDVVVCIANGSRRLVGKSAAVKTDATPLTFGAFMGCFRPMSADVDPHYVALLFQTEDYRRQVDVILAGSTINNLKPAAIEGMQFSIPRRTEQEAIVGALADVDETIDAVGDLLAKKRDVRSAVRYHLLTGAARLPGFLEVWQHVTVGQLGSMRRGRGIRKDDVRTDGVPCIRYGEIYTHHHNYVRRFHSFVASSVAADAQPLRTGDIIFAGSGETAEEIGKCVAFLGNEAAVAGGDTVILSPTGHDALFLAYLLNQPEANHQKASYAQGEAIVHISPQNLARIEIEVPDLPEQQAISTVLRNIDEEIDTFEMRLGKIKMLRRGMAQELLSGRTRLA